MDRGVNVCMHGFIHREWVGVNNKDVQNTGTYSLEQSFCGSATEGGSVRLGFFFIFEPLISSGVHLKSSGLIIDGVTDNEILLDLSFSLGE